MLEYAAVRILAGVARILPPSGARKLGRGLGSLVMRIWSKRRKIAHENLTRAFNESLASSEIEDITRETMRTMGQTMIEVFRFNQSTPEDILGRVDGDPAALRAAHEHGKGAILVSGHFGNWEVLAAWIRALGYELDVVVKPMRNPMVDAFYNRCRAAMNVGVIHSQVATKGIVRSLLRKRFVAILADQHTGAEGIDVDFFGRPASTPRGPAALAIRFGCPVLSGVLEQKHDGRFTAHVDGPITHQVTGDDEADVRAITQELTMRLEHHIRRTPGQWLWTHRRWRD